MQHTHIYIALGANQAYRQYSPRESLQMALLQLSQRKITIIKGSHIWQTPAWPDKADPEYSNAVAEIETSLEPAELMNILHTLETEFGRVRSHLNAPRTLDLDLIDYKGLISQAGPVLPHPRAVRRTFVLLPLREIAPDWTDPESGQDIQTLIAALPAEDRAQARMLSEQVWSDT